jgi:hypothetical protein
MTECCRQTMHAFRRRSWLRLAGSGVLAASLVGAAIWFFTPDGSEEVFARIRAGMTMEQASEILGVPVPPRIVEIRETLKQEDMHGAFLYPPLQRSFRDHDIVIWPDLWTMTKVWRKERRRVPWWDTPLGHWNRFRIVLGV